MTTLTTDSIASELLEETLLTLDQISTGLSWRSMPLGTLSSHQGFGSCLETWWR